MTRTALIFLSALVSQSLFPRGRGLNAEGCHNNRKTGDYHCHRSATPKRAVAPSGGGAYRNCTARAAGAAPVMRGEPGYGAHLNRDNDGIECE